MYSPRPWGWTDGDSQARRGRPVFPTPVGMDRSPRRGRCRCARIPHARGDGPGATQWRSAYPQYSPRPWGWTAVVPGAAPARRVFPTPVGMDRTMTADEVCCACIPHARGDGPRCGCLTWPPLWYSPRPWGWTVFAHPPVLAAAVFPTPVGMDRWRGEQTRWQRGIPHARGDGPAAENCGGDNPRYSPRPWGWTDAMTRLTFGLPVFPTPVGMDRGSRLEPALRQSIPHARGDGPVPLELVVSIERYSPRPWGWTGASGTGGEHRAVFPTPVGMDRRREALRSPPRTYSPRPWGWTETINCGCTTAPVFPTPVGMDRASTATPTRPGSIPHARGDGPLARAKQVARDMYAPRPWGWTVARHVPAHLPEVFPTPVGMDRRTARAPPARTSIPHARGDGPQKPPSIAPMSRYSPRPWGWTGRETMQALDLWVFPTPVGMDRLKTAKSLPTTCIPHARGDGPRSSPTTTTAWQYSPRPWGWTDGFPWDEPAEAVFPTPVGMDRDLRRRPQPPGSIPHARGDGPTVSLGMNLLRRYSPRPWGWTDVRDEVEAFGLVFPTPVGMDRRTWRGSSRRSGIPHARGDGPGV